MTKERPILFSAPMVRALLAGTKTQTRRVVKPWKGPAISNGSPVPADLQYLPDFTCYRATCHYGQPGDRLWVKETFRLTSAFDGDSPARVAERCLDAGYRAPWAPIQYEADGSRRDWMHVGTPPHAGPVLAGKTRVSIHMPRWASRISLEITEVRVQRLQEISSQDALCEGIEACPRGGEWRDYMNPNRDMLTPRNSYRSLWESINGPGSWDANPWVWALTFKVVKP